MAIGYFLRVGDRTTCGGQILTGDNTMQWYGVAGAREGDMVSSERLNVSLPDGKTALFRFYDPRVIHNIPQVLTSEQFHEITTPLIAWYYRFEGRFYALQGGGLNAV